MVVSGVKVVADVGGKNVGSVVPSFNPLSLIPEETTMKHIVLLLRNMYIEFTLVFWPLG